MEKRGRAAASLLRGKRSLEFFDDQILYRQGSGRQETYKFLSPASVAAAFRNAPIDSGWLAPGVIRCGATPRGEFAVLVVPAQRHSILIDGKGRARTLAIDLPSFAFVGVGTSYRVWAMRKTTPDAELFHAPLPNVFGNGSICWGANNPPEASAPKISEAWKLFLSTPFNGHAANHKVIGETGDVRPFLRQLARSREKFPTQRLRPFNDTLESMVEQVLGGREDDGH